MLTYSFDVYGRYYHCRRTIDTSIQCACARKTNILNNHMSPRTIGILSQISPTVQTLSNSLTIILLMFFSTIYSVSLCFWAFFTSSHFFVSYFCKVLLRIHIISILWISYNFSMKSNEFTAFAFDYFLFMKKMSTIWKMQIIFWNSLTSQKPLADKNNKMRENLCSELRY